MGSFTMKLELISLSFLPFLYLATGADVVCGPGNTGREVIKMEEGDMLTYKTQEGSTYGRRVKCKKVFKRKWNAQCNLSFSCTSFDIPNGQSTCNRPDFLKIGGLGKFCQTTGPDVTKEGRQLAVVFKSKWNSPGGPGAECVV